MYELESKIYYSPSLGNLVKAKQAHESHKAYFLGANSIYRNGGGYPMVNEKSINDIGFEQPKQVNADQTYLHLLLDILHNGTETEDRTGVGTLSVFGRMMRFDLQKGFPLLTTKKLHWKSIVGELLWFIGGCAGGIEGLKHDYGVTIWDEWLPLEKQGGKIAYKSMTEWEVHTFGGDLNQLKKAIFTVRNNPNSRRNLVLNWNPMDVDTKLLVLPACHVLFQFKVNNGKLDCLMFQRSADLFLGIPYNIASYALLTQLVAHECGLQVGELVVSIADAHIYKNHLEQVKTQLLRQPLQSPTIKLSPEIESVFDFRHSDIKLIGYDAHPTIKADVAV